MDRYQKAKEDLKDTKFKHFGIALILGILLILIALGFIVFSEIPQLFLVILIVIFLVFYSIVLFFLIEQIKVMEIEVEKIKTIEKYKYTTIDNPIIERVEVEKPILKDIKIPVYVKTKAKVPRGHRYKYLASEKGKIFHYASSRLARLIRPKNRIYHDSPSYFIKKGFKPSVRLLKRWKKEEKVLYKKYGPKKKKEKKIEKKRKVKRVAKKKGKKKVGKKK